MLLAALHCHCMQLLAQARDQLPSQTCALGQAAASNASSGGGCSSSQQQQQAWQQRLQQVQHNLVLVLQLTRHWQQDNVFAAFEKLYSKRM
jgi:hypothetical protein